MTTVMTLNEKYAVYQKIKGDYTGADDGGITNMTWKRTA
jgi:hypothetical protein